MSKEYFSHDYNTRNKTKMAAMIHCEKMKGYGLFWVIVEMLHEDSHKWMELEDFTYLAIQKASGCDVTFIKKFIEKGISNYKIFMREENRFTTERVLRNIDKRLEISEKRSSAGKASAAARQQNLTSAKHMMNKNEQVLNKNEQNSTKERKGKEIKVKEIKEIKEENRANALVVSGETTADLKQEYKFLLEEVNGKDRNEIYGKLKNFITEKRPFFPEPYVDAWNLVADIYGLEKAKDITDDRRDKVKIRVREPSFDFFKVLASIRQNKFYRGDNSSGWKVTFNYIIKSQRNYTQIIEKINES